MGVPARPVRPLREDELANNREIAARYARLKEEYAERLGRGWTRQGEGPVDPAGDGEAGGGS